MRATTILLTMGMIYMQFACACGMPVVTGAASQHEAKSHHCCGHKHAEPTDSAPQDSERPDPHHHQFAIGHELIFVAQAHNDVCDLTNLYVSYWLGLLATTGVHSCEHSTPSYDRYFRENSGYLLTLPLRAETSVYRL